MFNRLFATTVAVAFSVTGAIAGAGAGATPVAAPAELPLKDFFRNPDRGYFRISADGTTLAYMEHWEKRMNIFVYPLDGSVPPRRVTSEQERDIPDHFWKGSDRIVYSKDSGGDENFHVVVVDVKTGLSRDITPFPGVRAGVADPLPDFPDRMLIEMNQRNKEVFDVYEANLDTGELKMVAENPGNITGWGTDHAGNVRYAIATDGVNQTYLYRTSASAPFKPVLTTSFREAFEPQFFDATNNKLYVLSNLKRDKKTLVLVDPATAKEERVVFGRDDVDVAGAGWSRLRKRMTEIDYVTDRVHREFPDPDTAALYATLERKLPGYEINLQAITDDENRMIVAASSDRTAGTRYLYDRRADTLTKLGEISPWLPADQMAPMQPIQYTSRDGLTIHGYLTLPVGRDPKNLPVVVHPHGGPWARDVWGFDPEVQFLANRGYAVLQMNFRGSTGYGRKFWEASFGQWGLKMQDDITDGVDWLVKQGVADPKRICIYGASYGGYATLAGLTQTPDLYACGVDYVGVSNLLTFMQTIPPYWKPMLEMMYVQVGNPETDKARLTATSPALNAAKIKSPLLVAQGARDPRVNKDESDQMVAALKKRGIDVPYMVKDNEGHGFHNEENQLDFYAAMEKFLAKYLKPQP
jgi:dipeptidyl aminopeptidase/acylaminoacyl peptidase